MMTIIEGLRVVAEELEKVPVAGKENRERLNNCTTLVRMMIKSLSGGEESGHGGGDDPAGEREAKGTAGTV